MNPPNLMPSYFWKTHAKLPLRYLHQTLLSTPLFSKFAFFPSKEKKKHTMADSPITDLCDTYTDLVKEGRLKILQPIFQTYGGRKAFSGPIVTLKVFEDNVLVRESLEENGEGRVLMVDGGGSLRCALLGGNLAALAHNNGWSGIVVNGCVRDVEEMGRCDVGVRALAAHPLKSNKRGVGEKNGVVFIGGVRIMAGEWCYADPDGVLVSPVELSL